MFVANALGSTTATTSFSLTLPATESGDIIIVEYVHRGTGDATIGGTYSGPAFTEKHDQGFTGSLAATCSGKTLWSRATGNHSGQTVTGSGLTNSCAAIATVYRRAKSSGDPLADATVVGENNSSASPSQAGITTTTDRAYVVLVVGNSPDVGVSAQTAVTSPGALTERAELLSTGGTDTSISHASLEKATAGATGNLTWSQAAQDSGSWAYGITWAGPPADVGTKFGAAVTALTGVAPAAIANGDNVIARVAHSSASATTTPPSGWSLITGAESDPADFTSYVYKLDSAWSGSPALGWTFSVAVNARIDIVRIPGYQVDVAGTPGVVAAANTVTGSVTPSGNNYDVISFADCDATGEPRYWSNDVGTELFDDTGAEMHGVIVRRTISGGSGVSQSIQHTITGSAQDLAAIAIALAPITGPNDGTGDGAVGWAGSATGSRVSSGSGAGAVGWAASSTGTRVSRGSGSGAVGWAGSSTGARASAGSGGGAVGWSGSATGVSALRGAVAGAVGWAGSATGSRSSSGSGSGAVSWAASSTGVRLAAGSGSGTVEWGPAFATGEAPAGEGSGSASGTVAWAGSATGARLSTGSGSGTVTWAAAATGSRQSSGFGTVIAVEWGPAAAAGGRASSGAAFGLIVWAGSATSNQAREGSAAGAVVWGPAEVRGFGEPFVPSPERTVVVSGRSRVVTPAGRAREVDVAGRAREVAVAGRDRTVTVAGDARITEV